MPREKLPGVEDLGAVFAAGGLLGHFHLKGGKGLLVGDRLGGWWGWSYGDGGLRAGRWVWNRIESGSLVGLRAGAPLDGCSLIVNARASRVASGTAGGGRFSCVRPVFVEYVQCEWEGGDETYFGGGVNTLCFAS